MCPGPCIGPQGKPQSGICIIPPRTSPGAVGIAKAFKPAAGSPPPAPSTMGTPALGTDLIELQERPPKGVSEPQLLPHPGSCGISPQPAAHWPRALACCPKLETGDASGDSDA